MLRACRRVLRPGRAMGFFTIHVADGLSEAGYRLALRSGPSSVSSRRREHRDLLATAGFKSVEEIDLTDEFVVTARAWYTGRARYAAELTAALGEAAFQERQRDSAAQLKGIEAALLRRTLFICR